MYFLSISVLVLHVVVRVVYESEPVNPEWGGVRLGGNNYITKVEQLFL